MDLATLTLVPATREQTIESRRRTWYQWALGLPLEQYLARDNKVETSEHGREGKFMTWVLAPRDNPETLEFMCSCETYKRSGLSIRFQPDATLEQVVCYAVASVFTPPNYRHRGYAHHMMRLLHWVIGQPGQSSFPAEWDSPPQRVEGVPPGICSALWSDVGPDFYAACGTTGAPGSGWQVQPSISTVWTVSPNSELPAPVQADGSAWRWLDMDQLGAVFEADVELMKKELEYSAKQAHPGNTKRLFAFMPDRGLAVSQINRWIAMAHSPRFKLPPQSSMESPYGVCLREANGSDAQTFATWTVNAPALTMIVTRLRATPTSFASLLERVLSTARAAGMEQVEIWNLPKELREEAGRLGGSEEERTEHLAGLAWYGTEGPGEVQWLYNERFCWC